MIKYKASVLKQKSMHPTWDSNPEPHPIEPAGQLIWNFQNWVIESWKSWIDYPSFTS